MKIEVYHGSNVIVETPEITPYVCPLDFGSGFYVTTLYNQACRWAEKKQTDAGLKPPLAGMIWN